MSRKKIEMTPEDRLVEAIFGKTQADIEREDLEKAESVTDEEFKQMWGVSIEEHTNKMMNFVGWCNQIARWQIEKKKVGSKKYEFRDLVELAERFYTMGREDEKAGTDMRQRLWPDEKKEA